MKASNKYMNASFAIFIGYMVFNQVAYYYTNANPWLLQGFIVIKKYGFNVPISLKIIYLLWLFCILISFFFYKKSIKYGFAEWAKLKDIKRMGLLNEEGLILGRLGKTVLRYYLPALSTLILAPSGTGKTTSVAIPNLIWLGYPKKRGFIIRILKWIFSPILKFLNYRKPGYSLIVHDPKGELTKFTAIWRSKFSKVSVFDPVSPYSAKFNPMAENLLPKINPEEIDIAINIAKKEGYPYEKPSTSKNGKIDLSKTRTIISRISTTLIPDTKDGEKYFSAAARTMFVYLAMWLIWHDNKGSIPDIRNLILCQPDAPNIFKLTQKGLDPREEKQKTQEAEFEQEYEEKKSQPLTPDEENQYQKLKKNLLTLSDIDQDKYFELNERKTLAKITGIKSSQDFHDPNLPQLIKRDGNGLLTVCKSEKQFAGVIDVLIQALTIFSDETIARNTGHRNDFSAKEFRTNQNTLYVVVRDEDRVRLRPLMALLFETLANDLTSTLPTSRDHIVTFLLDEFLRLDRLEAIKALPEIGRGYKTNVILIAQDYGQMRGVYDENTVETFDSNTAYKIIFTQNSQKTAEKVSKTIGKTTVIRKNLSQNTNSFKSSGANESLSEEGIPLVTDQEIMNLTEEESIILVQKHLARPIKSNNFRYYKNKEMNRIIKKYGFSEEESFNKVYQALAKQQEGKDK